MKQQVDSHQDAAHPPAQGRQPCAGSQRELFMATIILVMSVGLGPQAFALSGYVGEPGLGTGVPVIVNTFPVDPSNTENTGVALLAVPGDTAVEKQKFFCDMRYDSAETALACAQQPTDLLAVQVPSGFGITLGAESATSSSFSTVGTVATFTAQFQGQNASTVTGRGALICESAGDSSGNQYCVKIQIDPTLTATSLPTTAAPLLADGITPKFVLDNNVTECANDLATMQAIALAGTTAEVDWTTNRFPGDPNNLNDPVHRQLRINVCAVSRVEFLTLPGTAPLSPPVGVFANVYEWKQISKSMVFTPLTCKISGKTYSYKTPPVYKCP